jgi:CBS domain-containing protein
MDFSELTAGELMVKDVKTISQTMTMVEAAKLMHDLDVSCLVVERAAENDAFGIVTRKDIVEALVEESMAPMAQLVSDVMSKPAITVAPYLSIVHCLQYMRMVGVRRLPVVESGTLVGILSNTDMFKSLADRIKDG